ncbi:MAG: C-terminal binding protein, partial [Actinobacteria bacterium]|nr:C-terminal binding protein [Actinomycetota bacterium]NIS36134.1 C-terminal binding protein [Actinomycetota bacterium]NIT98543.1 C-terminal binding protein [Actinomycetota bacterium]NIU70703.1 C-terminal binding protein [Actinomycetota bacterium]NIV90292.1 C-terminal binding protein [Actinomycetota bacterium]
MSGDGAGPEEILAVAADADVILAGSRPRFDADVIAGLGCTAIVRAGIGVDSVDLDAARAAGCWVVNVPDYGTEAVASHALALALTGMRRIVQADRSLRSGSWGFAGLRPLHLPAASVAGVVGFGRIGRRAAELLSAAGFGRVLAHDPFTPVALPGVEEAGF